MDYLDELKQKFSEALSSAPADAGRARLLDAAKSFVGDKREELHKMHFDGAGGAAVVGRYTSLVDSLVQAIYRVAIEEKDVRSPHALVALGGYGRRELCFCSDLDIMFLHEGRLSKGLEAANDYLLYFLWDLGFEVGHSIRSMRESLKLARLDNTALTSMLESRLLAGDASTFEKFTDRLATQIKSAGIKRFIRRRERERKRNYCEAGDDVYHNEPNIKQTAGGLRDYHTGIWIALARFRLKSPREFFNAGLLTDEQFLKLERVLDFLWRVRNQMHLDNGAPLDVLTLSRQEQIAHAFGYRAFRGALAVELFMQDYYTHAMELHRFYREMLRLGGLSEKRRRKDVITRGGKVERGLRIARRRVYLPARDPNWFRENPARLLEVVWYSQKHGFMLSESAEAEMRANLNLIDEQFRASPIARDYFMAILSDISRVGSTVRQMSDIGILDRYLPEFSAIRHVVRYDPFHQYPVDEHTLRALENLAAIPHLSELGTDVLKQILSEIRTPEILSLAILLHDLGKTEEGSHVRRGVRTAEAVGQRLALNEKQMETLRFLVRNHLKMTHLSQYRDLDDWEITRSFASEVGSEENLNMLYLLTFADLYAVRQGAWNDWKSALLFRLYSRTKQMLAQPLHAEDEQAEYWNTTKASAICEYLPKPDFHAVKRHLSLMSPRYLACFSPKEIATHMSMASSLQHKVAVFKCVGLPNYSLSQITVCAKDRLGLFAEMAGTFASQQVSVLSAAVFTRSDGVAIDSFHVVDGETDGPLSSTKWAVVKENLRKALRGERDVGQMIRSVERSPRVARRTMSSLRRGVYFDNRVSATHTVIDIEAPDRIGLLYDIASTFSELGLNLSVARVATEVRQARDAFYVTDSAGKKITDPLRIQKIRERLEEALEPRQRSLAVENNGSRKAKRRVKAT
jgi:[protein-PII] uridylyltransferase